MKRMTVLALLASATLAHAQSASAPASAPVSAAKKELVQKVLLLQQPAIENMARNLVEQPAGQMMQAAGRALQQQVPAEKRESVGKGIEADVKKYVDESYPVVRERAVKIAPTTIGSVLEEKFSEDELKQLIAWLESSVNKKYLQLGPEMQNGFMQKLVSEARPVLDPKLQALETKVRTALGVPAGPPASGAPAAAGSAPVKAAAPARKASGAK
ncbi:MAG: DUF2059 domain-containing protein [Burkholderiaceae bacterium]